MKSTTTYALAALTVGLVAYGTAGRVQASPSTEAKPSIPSIDRTAIRKLESKVTTILGKSKNASWYTVFVAGQSSESMIRQTAIETVRVSLGYSKLSGDKKNRADAIIARATTAIDQSLPDLRKIAKAAPTELIVGANEVNDIHFFDSRKGAVHIYPVEAMSMPKHLKARAIGAMNSGPKSDLVLTSKESQTEVELTVFSGKTKFSVNLPKVELSEKESIRTRVRGLIESGQLPECSQFDEDRIVDTFNWAGQPKPRGMTFRFSEPHPAIGGMCCHGGINRYLSTIAPS
jgi:hypothetical protein